MGLDGDFAAERIPTHEVFVVREWPWVAVREALVTPCQGIDIILTPA